ncbi:DUF6916 family protein [Pulveribacter sp.]|uniref:DUF6916 family protein n=1 Tax=Pulveribacter sp. TaxID=2678893 RepID=UPI0028987051|nr:hypothetical protein [Pulveribacter sp.]
MLDSALFSRTLTWPDAQCFARQQVLAHLATPAGPITVPLTVCEVAESPAAPGAHQFRISFQGPADAFLTQGTYRMQHPQLGDYAIFMTPVARRPEGFVYEACFSHVG